MCYIAHASRRVALALVFCLLTHGSSRAGDSFEANWESLRQHQPAPDWFRDAKFGIYFHWGVYSVPAYGNEWYPRHMHDKEGDRSGHIYRHHVKTFGDPAEYGYDKFVPMFKAENFDAEEWIDLFAKAGAKFAGPVAEHHDGFSMWDSELTPWNAMDRGPKRDIMGEMAEAARKRNMKVVATFHHARNNLWEHKQKGKIQWTGHYSLAKRHFPSVLEDRERAILYGYLPRDEFLKMWLGKLDEVISKYSPDLIWFDSWLHEIPEQTRMQFLANYLNHAAENDQEVLVTYKQKDMPQDICVLDLEKGGMADVTDFVWLTDDTISLGSWCYTNNLKIKPTNVVLHSLIDIVSKNGQLILNISPKADGSIPENQRRVLLEIGQWLDKYGEAIYNTRPIHTYGHGPTTAGKGHFGGIALNKGYTSQDIRYTRNGTTVYALQLGASTAGEEVLLKAFAQQDGQAPFTVESISLLGSDQQLQWQQTADGVTIIAVAQSPDSMANTYKLKIK